MGTKYRGELEGRPARYACIHTWALVRRLYDVHTRTVALLTRPFLRENKLALVSVYLKPIIPEDLGIAITPGQRVRESHSSHHLSLRSNEFDARWRTWRDRTR